MAKTNSKKVMLADDLERIVAGVVSEKTKEYLNDGYILADFKEFQSDRTFKVLLFDDLNLENDFQVILVETNYVYRQRSAKGLCQRLSSQKFLLERLRENLKRILLIFRVTLMQLTKLKFIALFV